jgi:phage tail-like protein
MQPSGLAVDGDGNFYFGDRRSLSVGEEEERFIFRLSPSGDSAEPVAGYRGAVAKLALDRANRLVVFNPERQEINILRGEKQFLRTQFQKLPAGRFYSQALDSTNPGQRWHKIVLDAHIPANTQIKLAYAISDDPKGTPQWSEPLINPKDALIRGPAGRYLYLKVELIGSDWETPTLKSLRVYLPRRSYLRYLPAVYQEDETSRDFLERFLSIFETCLSDIEGQIDRIVRYFDAEVVSPDFLPWLASWLAIAVDENWTQAQLRQLIQQAPQLYRQRGTRAGIAATVEILTGFRPLLVESFQVECSKLKNPFRFWVLLDKARLQNERELQSLQRLIDAEKPAHTEAVLRVLQPWIALDRESYLGYNSRVFEPSLRLDRTAAISQESVLTDSEAYGQIGRRSRLSLDTVMN